MPKEERETTTLSSKVNRMYRTKEDVERLSASRLCDLLEILRAERFNPKRRKWLSNYSAKRRKQVLSRERLKVLRETDGALEEDPIEEDLAEVDEDETFSDDIDEDSHDEKDQSKSSNHLDHSSVQATSSTKFKEATKAWMEDLEVNEKRQIREEIARNKLMMTREAQAQRMFTPYFLPHREKMPAVMGAMGHLVEAERSPAFENFAHTETDVGSFRGSVVVYAEVDQVVAAPLTRRTPRIFTNQILRSHKLPTGIFQLSQLHHPSGAWFVARREQQMTLVGMNPEERVWEIREIDEQWRPEGDILHHLCPSPYEPGRIAALKRHSLHIWDVHEAPTGMNLCTTPDTSTSFRKCVFGSHPSEIYLNTNRMLGLVDSRKSRKTIVDVFQPYGGDKGPMSLIDSDILSFERIPGRRDELLMITRTELLLLDMRNPSRFIARETHAMKLESPEHLSVECVFSRGEAPSTFIYSTDSNPPYILAGPIPPVPSLDPSVHRRRIKSGLPFDPPSKDPTSLRVSQALAPFDHVRSVDPFALRSKVPRVMARFPDRIKRLPSRGDQRRDKDAQQQQQQQRGINWRSEEPKLTRILAAGFHRYTNHETVFLVGPTVSHVESHNALTEPILISKELDVK